MFVSYIFNITGVHVSVSYLMSVSVSVLHSWKGKYLAMRGRVVLINSVLNSLPCIFLSFYRALKKIIQTLISIQRKFLWHEWSEAQKITWVS